MTSGSKPCTRASCWDQFTRTQSSTVPSDLVDGPGMPPQWRPQIRYQWDLRVSGPVCLTASVSADAGHDATGQTVSSPGFPRLREGARRLEGGAALKRRAYAGSGGLPP